MAAEQLIQEGYIDPKLGLKGKLFGTRFEELGLGSTTVQALIRAGLVVTPPESIKFPFTLYEAPKKVINCKPDKLYITRDPKTLTNPRAVAVTEFKIPKKLKGAEAITYTAEQGLFAAVAVGADIAVITDGTKELYVDVGNSLSAQNIVFIDEPRRFSPAVLADLVDGGAVVRDPGELAEKVWQIIWHATKDEPKECLLTFVEIFVLKFLSDNLPPTVLPKNESFYELLRDPADFQAFYGCTPIEHYIKTIRPRIKQIFPDNTIVSSGCSIPSIFGLSTVVSKSSIINGFSFLDHSESTSPASYNHAFVEILKEFERFGTLTAIDPEFKLRLYETFLKKSARQQKLGQFFTPRNVVQQIVRMADIKSLPDGSVILDPACGVGGFVLEPGLVEVCLKDNLTFQHGTPKRRITLLGVDVDKNTHILGKANVLLHHAEAVRSAAVTIDALNQLMAQTLVLMNANKTLGALEYPPFGSIDLIMTNPPYVTQGSKIYKEEIKKVDGPRNGQLLPDYYDGCGLGLESLFLRYISGALKPGGHAFVIVPQGLLTRTETGTKDLVLRECNLLASIALPRNTFFNTPQKTYILALEKRRTADEESEPRPPVFCAITRTIGESLDYRRVPTPNDNDLATIADVFLKYREAITEWRSNGGDVAKLASDAVSGGDLVKSIDAGSFTKNDRWDSARFWTSDELEKLGVVETAVSRFDFIDESASVISTLATELEAAKAELAELSKQPTRDFLIGDPEVDPSGQPYLVPVQDENGNPLVDKKGNPIFEHVYPFTVRRGKRVRKEDCDKNPGDPTDTANKPYPVYSGSKNPLRPLGIIGNKWLDSQGIPVENLSHNPRGIVTVNANGYVGAVFVRKEPCVIHDDVMVIEVNRPDIDLEYLAFQLKSAIAEGNFEYEAKLYNRVVELAVRVPVSGHGFDLAQQQKISAALRRFEGIRSKIADFGVWSASSRIKED